MNLAIAYLNYKSLYIVYIQKHNLNLTVCSTEYVRLGGNLSDVKFFDPTFNKYQMNMTIWGWGKNESGPIGYIDPVTQQYHAECMTSAMMNGK